MHHVISLVVVDGLRTSAMVPHADMLNHLRPRETKVRTPHSSLLPPQILRLSCVVVVRRRTESIVFYVCLSVCLP